MTQTTMRGRQLAALLPQTATVYTAAATTGEYTVAAKSGLLCQLAHVRSQSYPGGPERSERVADRTLYFDPDYALPSEHVEIEINGERWAIVAGTVTDQRDRADALIYRKADVTKVVT